jgi:DNA-directed RNA polymerases I and III subunit RPAC1
VPDEVATDRNTIVFRLQAACTRNPKATQGETDPQKLYHHSNGRRTRIKHQLQLTTEMLVLTSDLEWQPQGEQASIFKDNHPSPTNPNVLLAKLRPGQEIDIEMHAIKGIGATHAKWSPVGVCLPVESPESLLITFDSHGILSITSTYSHKRSYPPCPGS